MPVTSKDALREQLKRREIAPVYVLHGPESALRDIAARTIADLAFSEGDFRDFNEDTYSLSTSENLLSALAAAEQLPMMANRRVIKIADARIAATSQRDTLKEEFEPALAAYLANPSPQTVLIILADEINGNRKITKLLQKHAVVVEFMRLEGPDLVEWTKSSFDKLGARIDITSVRHLIALTGPDLRRLSSEIGKLATAAITKGTVTVDLIDELVAHKAELSNFDLTDHLVAGRKSQAMAAMRKILSDGAEPLALLGLISYNFRRLLMAKSMMESGADRSDVAKILKLRYSDQEPFLAAARRAETRRLASILKRLAAVDLAIKTSVGGGGPHGSAMQIEMLVSEIAASAHR